MTTITFDTLKVAEKLEKAGASRELAAAIAEAQRQFLAEALDTTLATKADIGDFRHEMRESRTEMNGKFTLLQWMLAALIGIAIANFAKQFF